MKQIVYSFLFLCICLGLHSQKIFATPRVETVSNKTKQLPQNKMQLILYMRPECPCCKKVLRTLAELDKTIELRNIANAQFKSELLEKGGKVQVPCLFINGDPLYESDVIVNWLKTNKRYY